MKLNISKCKVLSLCRNSGNIVKYYYGFDVTGQGFVPLECECKVKDLGVIMCSEFSFDDHIYDKINVANKLLGIIRRNFVYSDVNCFLLIYKSMVRSHLEYACSVWNPYKKSLIRDIEKIQKGQLNLCEYARIYHIKID